MFEENRIQSVKELPSTHFFIYRSQKYPFNIDLFKIMSNYFTKNPSIIEAGNKSVKLFDTEDEERIHTDDDTIKSFIQFFHRQPIQLHNKNVIILNFLSAKYEIDELKEATEKYIKKHHEELVVDLLSVQQKDSILTNEKYEEIISKNFLHFIQNENIFSLQMSSLYRIMKKFVDENKQDIFDNNEVQLFLMKCLDVYGQKASVLFSDVEIFKFETKYINLLFTKYSEIFDFHFINSNMLKSFYDKQSELVSLEMKNEKEIEKNYQKIKDELESVKIENSQLKKVINQIKEKAENDEKERTVMKNEIEQLKKEIVKLKFRIEYLKRMKLIQSKKIKKKTKLK